MLAFLHIATRVLLKRDEEVKRTTEECAHSNWRFSRLTQPCQVWVIYLSIIFTCYFQHNEALQCTLENNTFWKMKYQIGIKKNIIVVMFGKQIQKYNYKIIAKVIALLCWNEFL